MTSEEEKAVFALLGNLVARIPGAWFDPHVKSALEVLGFQMFVDIGCPGAEPLRMPHKRLADSIEGSSPNQCAKCGTNLSGVNVQGSLCPLCSAYEEDMSR